MKDNSSVVNSVGLLVAFTCIYLIMPTISKIFFLFVPEFLSPFSTPTLRVNSDPECFQGMSFR